MEKDKRLIEASWWERLKGKLGLVLMGRAMLSKSLIQFFIARRGCVPSLLLDLRPDYGGGISELWGTLKLLQSNLLEEETKAQRDEKIHSGSHSWLPVCTLSHVQLFGTSWTVACQLPLGDSPDKNTGVGCHDLLQGIFLTQELKPWLPRLLHFRQIPYPLSHLGSIASTNTLVS